MTLNSQTIIRTQDVLKAQASHAPLPFSCRKTLEQLRESYEELHRLGENTNKMRMVRVEYTVETTGPDGKTISKNKERVLSDLTSTDPTYIQEVLEEVVRATEEFGEKHHCLYSPRHGNYRTLPNR